MQSVSSISQPRLANPAKAWFYWFAALHATLWVLVPTLFYYNTYFDIAPGKPQIYRVQLNAAYQGHFYLPTISCEAMYDNNIQARQPGMWVDVISSEGKKAL